MRGTPYAPTGINWAFTHINPITGVNAFLDTVTGINQVATATLSDTQKTADKGHFILL
jgi:hypothetical protein